MKSISILGSGWLGLPLAKHFISAGHPVNASTTSKSRLPELATIKVEAFLIDIDKLNENIKSFLQADILIINVPPGNIEGFHKLKEEIDTSKIKNILFVSSTSVYGNNNKTISEPDGEELVDSPLLAIESLFRNITDIETTIIRLGGLIGYNRNLGRFFSKGRLIDNPDSPVNLIHRDDCIEIISQIIEQEIWGEVFNCCADTHPTKREFYTHAANSVGSAAPEFSAAGTTSFKIVSNKKVKQTLDYKFFYADLMKIKF